VAARSFAPAVQRAAIALPFEAVVPAQPGQGFCRTYRLLGTDEFSSVFAFRRSLRGRFYTLYYRPNELDTARLGVTVAKKLVKRANGRNLVKRIAREVFRRQRGNLPACDLVIRLHAPVGAARRAELNMDVRQLLGRLPGSRKRAADSIFA
jgi:ribonuclease P protein component